MTVCNVAVLCLAQEGPGTESFLWSKHFHGCCWWGHSRGLGDFSLPQRGVFVKEEASLIHMWFNKEEAVWFTHSCSVVWVSRVQCLWILACLWRDKLAESSFKKTLIYNENILHWNVFIANVLAFGLCLWLTSMSYITQLLFFSSFLCFLSVFFQDPGFNIVGVYS